jgi:hypothetical protein
MSQYEKFLSKLEKITTNPPVEIVVRAGESRTNEDIIGKWEYPIEDIMSFVDDVQDCLPYQNCKHRLIALDEKKKQIRAVTISGRAHEPSNQSEPVAVLVDGINMMMTEYRRAFSVLAGVIEAREDTIENIFEGMILAREEAIDNTLAVGMLQMENEALQDVQDSNAKERALQIAEKALAGAMQPKITPDTIKNIAIAHPEIIKELMKDEEFRKMVIKVATEK